MFIPQIENYTQSTYNRPINLADIERRYDVNSRNNVRGETDSTVVPDTEMKGYYKALRNPNLTYDQAVSEISKAMNTYRFQFNDDRPFTVDSLLLASDDTKEGREEIGGAGVEDVGYLSHNDRCHLAILPLSAVCMYVDDNYTFEQMSVWYINVTQAALDVMAFNPSNDTGHGQKCTNGQANDTTSTACQSDDYCPRRELRNTLLGPFRAKVGENYFGIPYEDERYDDIVKARLEAALATGVTTVEDEIAYRENRAHGQL